MDPFPSDMIVFKTVYYLQRLASISETIWIIPVFVDIHECSSKEQGLAVYVFAW